MTYVVTARKWRPQIFEEVVGQSHITKTLKNAIENNRIAHAYIFAGPRGVGKTTTARILAKRLNCMNPQNGEPCNRCDMCHKFQSQQTMDIIEIDGASNRRIDEIRTLRESVKYAPTTGKFKVYIIDEVHMLTTESFNALLKTLEEPPEHTIFIFATTDVHKVPLTILSRCQRFDFRRIELIEIKSLLAKIAKAEDIEIDDKSLTIIAKKADGALRDAQSLFDQVVSYCGKKITAEDVVQMLNIIDEEIYFELTDAVLTKNYKAAFEISQKIYSNGWNFIDFINGLLEHFRNLLTVRVTNSSKLIEAGEMTKKRLESFKDSFAEADLIRILTYLTKLLVEVKIAQNQKLRTEIGLTHIIGIENSSTITELLNYIKSKPELLQAASASQTSEVKKKPVIKEELKVEPNEVKTNVFKAENLNDFRRKWREFTEFISQKKFTIGSHLLKSNPDDFQSNVLTVIIEDPEDFKIISKQKETVQKSLNEFFNCQISVELKSFESKTKVKLNGGASAIPDNHPLIKAVIEELGGKEI